ncbi:MAG: phosphoribosylanthranilate isomerase [Candidatus Firestonebacteria bacterium]
MTKVKICGITNLEDALAAVEYGADALGFVFAKSLRQISPVQARKIISKLPPFIGKIGVFVNEAPSRVVTIAKDCGLTAVQLHGEELPEFIGTIKPLTIIKTIRVKNKKDISILVAYPEVEAFLLDTFVAGKSGGTGKVFDWELALLAKKLKKPIILSGGLSALNVQKAIKIVSPYSVDVSSGVESKPGKKDHKKLRAFIKNAKE